MPSSLLSIVIPGSSSSGNSCVIFHENGALLIDAGLPLNYTLGVLENHGIKPKNLDGVLITHLHGDHVNPASVRFFLKEGIPFYMSGKMTAGFKKKFMLQKNDSASVFAFKTGSFVSVGQFSFTGFPLSHDSRGGCFGYNVFYGKKKISVATDLSTTDELVRKHFTDSDVYVIESNHDPVMLENSGRSAHLINRIHKTGHLSNIQCAEFLDKTISLSKIKPRAVYLAHISRDCNTNETALRTSRAVLDRLFLKETLLFETYRRKASRCFQF